MLLGTEKLAVLQDASLFVLPSYSENFGLAVVEAMAAGRPVIISDQVNIWREVEAAGAGKVVPCDAPRLAEEILHLLDTPEMAGQMGQKGQALVREAFQWHNIALRLQESYAMTIDRHRRRLDPER